MKLVMLNGTYQEELDELINENAKLEKKLNKAITILAQTPVFDVETGKDVFYNEGYWKEVLLNDE